MCDCTDIYIYIQITVLYFSFLPVNPLFMCLSLASTVSWPSPVWHLHSVPTHTHTHTHTGTHKHVYIHIAEKNRGNTFYFNCHWILSVHKPVCNTRWNWLWRGEGGGGRSVSQRTRLNLPPWEWKGWTNLPPEHGFSLASPTLFLSCQNVTCITQKGEKKGGGGGGRGGLQWQSLFGGKLTSLLFLAVP